MKAYRVALLLLWPIFTGVAGAQQTGNQPAQNQPALNPPVIEPRILRIDDEMTAIIPTLANRNDVDAISLGLHDEVLQAQLGGVEALQTWVAAGGIALLHTDAAQHFEYTTVAARPATAAMAGQFFGRAVAALPFGAHPLLWENVALSNTVAFNGTTPSNGTAPNLATTRPTTRGAASTLGLEEPGVQVVYYQLRDGDHLVVQHPSAVPLLRVTDLAMAQDESLYAAAIAPYGQGWTVFLPSFINPDRADGGLFLDNLMQWVTAMSRAPRPSAAAPDGATDPNNAEQARPAAVQWYSLPATFIESTSDVAAGAGGVFNAQAALQELYKIFQAPEGQPPLGTLPPVLADDENAAAQIEATLNPARVMLTREETATLAAQLNSAARGAGINEDQTAVLSVAQVRAAVLLYLLRARLEYQRGQTETATGWVQAADALLPDAAEVDLWKGVLTAGNAQDITLSSQIKAQLLTEAAEHWRAAVQAPTVAGIGTGTQTAQIRTVSHVPLTTLQFWIISAERRARLLSVEPPLVTLLGSRDSPVVLRHFPDDPTLRLALPAGDMLPRASQAAGWRADSEEILIFPTAEYYQAYRAAAGLRAPLIADQSGAGGDVVGNRILMVSQPALPVILPPRTPGGAPRTVQFGTAVPIIISRLHAYILMNQLVQDGNPPPAWMQIGIVTLSNLSVVSDAGLEGLDTGTLRRFAAANGLLGPEQFRGALAQAVPGSAVEAQAGRMLSFFYAEFGAGAVVETLQRLGEGQSVDEAIFATTGLSEEEFFFEWRDAEFGVL